MVLSLHRVVGIPYHYIPYHYIPSLLHTDAEDVLPLIQYIVSNTMV